MSQPRTLVAAVLSWHLPEPRRWHEYVRERLAEHGLSIVDGELFDETAFIGEVDLLEPDEAAAVYAEHPWFSLADRGSFRGRPVGYFCWNIYSDDYRVAELVFLHMRGTVGRTDTDEALEPIVEREVSLAGLIERFGYEDRVISRDQSYGDELVARVERALARAGYTGMVSFDPDAPKNPLRLVGSLNDGEAEIEPTYQVLAPITAPLLVFDWSVLNENDEFWKGS